MGSIILHLVYWKPSCKLIALLVNVIIVAITVTTSMDIRSRTIRIGLRNLHHGLQSDRTDHRNGLQNRQATFQNILPYPLLGTDHPKKDHLTMVHLTLDRPTMDHLARDHLTSLLTGPLNGLQRSLVNHLDTRRLTTVHLTTVHLTTGLPTVGITGTMRLSGS